MDGWVKFHRKAYDNFLYKENRPHTKREAWEDIIALVNFEDSFCLIGNEKIECKRGQSVRSLETWGKLFNWDKSKVKRFFDLLSKEKMIIVEDVRKTTRLTVCNYEEYQGDRNTDETQVKRKRNASETQTKPIKEEKEKEEKKEIEARAKKFYFEISEFISHYPKEMLRKFYEYWIEPNKSKTKMRFELEPTWDLSRRLKTWADREKIAIKTNSVERMPRLTNELK